jgi:hypothetical protein
MPDERTDDPRQVLSGFLTETTRHVRRTLLAVTTVALAVKFFGMRVTKLSLLGRDGRWYPPLEKPHKKPHKNLITGRSLRTALETPNRLS